MANGDQGELLSPLTDLRLSQLLLADLHDDLSGKVARFRQLADVSASLGSNGTMMPGGEIVAAAWMEARASFVHGNYIATVMLCQALAEQMLAAHLSLALEPSNLPKKTKFSDTLDECLRQRVITKETSRDLRRLMELRNPFSHFRRIDDPSNLSRRTIDTRQSAESHLLGDASFAIGVAVRLLALPSFRVD